MEKNYIEKGTAVFDSRLIHRGPDSKKNLTNIKYIKGKYTAFYQNLLTNIQFTVTLEQPKQ